MSICNISILFTMDWWWWWGDLLPNHLFCLKNGALRYLSWWSKIPWRKEKGVGELHLSNGLNNWVVCLPFHPIWKGGVWLFIRSAQGHVSLILKKIDPSPEWKIVYHLYHNLILQCDECMAFFFLFFFPPLKVLFYGGDSIDLYSAAAAAAAAARHIRNSLVQTNMRHFLY